MFVGKKLKIHEIENGFGFITVYTYRFQAVQFTFILSLLIFSNRRIERSNHFLCKVNFPKCQDNVYYGVWTV